MEMLYEVLTQYINVTILVFCLIVGYVLKNHTTSDNQNIPTIVIILGVVLAVANALTTSQPINLDVLVVGGVSGLASTGLHQLVKTWLAKLGG